MVGDNVLACMKELQSLKKSGNAPKVLTRNLYVDTNLHIRVGLTRATYFFRGRVDGVQFEMNLMRWNKRSPAKSLAAAVEERDRLVAMIAEGLDPREEVKAEKARREITIEAVIDNWLTKKTPKNPDEIRASITRHIYSHISTSRPADSVTETQFRRALMPLLDAGKGEMAKKLLTWLKSAYKVSRATQGITSRVLDDISAGDLGIVSKSRERVLEPAELATVVAWTKTNKPRDAYYRNLAQFLIGYCCRTQEIRLSTVDEWDLDAMVWTVPAAHSKNGEEIHRPILPEHLPLIRELIRAARWEHKSPYLLGKLANRGTVSGYVSKLSRRLGVAGFTWHDLRRTGSTIMADLGVHPEVRESILGHKLQGVAGTYNRAKALVQKRDALEQLHAVIFDGKGLVAVGQ